MGLIISIAGGGTGGGGLILITNATVITNITNESNWINGVYDITKLAGLVQWNYYTDNNYEYIYDGTTLVRTDVKLSVTTQMDITGDNTGFRYPDSMLVTDNGDDTVTLTSADANQVEAYFHGLYVPTIISGYTSPATTALDTAKLWFLTYNGTDIAWRDISIYPDFFKDTLISFAFYDTTNTQWVFTQETHGMVMDKDTHSEFHFRIGTWKESGGDITGIVLSSTTAANRRPITSQSIIKDEDKATTIPQLLVAEGYTQGRNTGTGTFTFVKAAGDIIKLSTNRPYWNSFSTPNWGDTLFNTDQWGTIWQIQIPVALGSSQAYRNVFVQPQWVTSTAASGGSAAQRLAAAQTAEEARNIGEINITSLTGLTPESVGIKRYTIRYNGTTWTVENVITLTGSRYSQTQSPSGNFLSAVAHDNTLFNQGTGGSPLGVVGNNTDLIETTKTYNATGYLTKYVGTYRNNGSLTLEIRNEYTGLNLTKSEINDGATGVWVRKEWTYTNSLQDVATETIITAWTI